MQFWVLFDRYYIALMSWIAPVILYLNYNAQLRKDALDIYYKNFATIIKNGFDLTVTTTNEPLTFPMWGYGWVMLLTENHIALVVIQFALAFLTVWYFIRTIEQNSLLPSTYIRILKIITVCALPWYAFHSVRWPYSIASSLAIFSIAALYQAIRKNHFPLIISSALAFGLLLHFRSDYFLMPVILATITLYSSRTIPNLKKMALWLSIVYLLLIPWALFTKKVCDHYLITSTNGGHVCLAGLGQYPGNKWNIAAINTDGCPIIHTFVDDVYGPQAWTWDYKGDVVLKSKFLELVKNDPWEYTKKCIYVIYLIATEGVYNGEFIEKENRNSIKIGHSTSIERFLRIATQYVSRGLASHITLSAYLLLPVAFFAALSTNSLFFLLSIGMVLFQTALNIFCYHATCYTSNIFFLFLVSIVYVLYAAFSSIGITKKRII